MAHSPSIAHDSGGSRLPAVNQADEGQKASSSLVSVITVCFNAAATLPATIASVAAQTCANYEFIVVDGGSSDGTLEVLRKHDAHINRWVSAPDGGMYDAMNKGAAMASGQYLAFLNADDRYLPHTVAMVARELSIVQPDVLYGNMIKVREIDGETFDREEVPHLDFMPRGMGIFHPATFVKKEVFEAAGGYDTTYRLAADYALLLKLWKGGSTFHYLDAPLAYFSLGGASNAGCGTYAEAADIQKKFSTGYAGKTRLLLWKCRFRKAARKAIFAIATITGTRGWVQRRIRKKWEQ